MKKYLCFSLVLLSSTANASLINSYDFNDTLSDTMGNGVDLVASGGNISSGRYNFTDNQGLKLTSALPSTSDYAIEIKFQINQDTSGYNKVIDFQNLASDVGLYIFSGAVDFYTAGPTAGSISIDTDYTLGLARSDGSITVFLDNNELFSTSDSNQAVSASNILNFFEDDSHTGQREAFTGSVDFIRIHNDSSSFGEIPNPVPVPAAMWLFASGFAGLWGMRKRSSYSN